ncbi:MAG: ribonuclease [Planctomycetes bacterium RBG_16_59_8]|nr:MAG: ribonuclease [Planctomycetes bacterium RBG_16_59_8]
MVLVDTSVWVDHFRVGNERLSQLLDEGLVLTHPFVIGELALGNIENRREILDLLGRLPQSVAASDNDVLTTIEGRKLWGKGIGLVDAHLLASSLLSNAQLFTLDKRLAAFAPSLLRDARS